VREWRWGRREFFEGRKRVEENTQIMMSYENFKNGVEIMRLLSGLCYWKSTFRIVIEVSPGGVSLKRYLPPEHEDGIPSNDGKYVERVKIPNNTTAVQVTQDTVLAVVGEIFHLSMALLHDLTDHMGDGSYTIVIDAMPNGVTVNKTPKA